MAHTTTMVREYADETTFHTDEMKLGQEGWSVESKVNKAQTLTLMQRLMARFTAATQVPFVVTYSRSAPS